MNTRQLARNSTEQAERLAMVRSVSTNVLRLIPDLVAALEAVSIDPIEFLQKGIERAKARANHGQ